MTNKTDEKLPFWEAGSFNQDLGIEMLEWREGYAKIKLEVQQRHLNRSDALHGGVMATLLDAVTGYAGTWCSVPGNARRGATLNLTTNFLAAGGLGAVYAEADVVGGGRKIFFAEGRVIDSQGKLLATASATYKLFRGSEEITGMPI